MINWRAEQLFRLTLGELYRLRVAATVCFIVVCIGSISVGVAIPKNFSSSATVLAERRDILQPLMEGRAVGSATPVTDEERVRFFRELLFSREILERVADEAGWYVGFGSSEAVRQQRLSDITARTELRATGPNLVRITVNDNSPDRSYLTAKLFAELLVTESERDKTRESTEAFEFIDRQVRDYHAKLVDAEERLTKHRSDNVDVGQGTEVYVSQRISELSNQLELSKVELGEARTRLSSIENQLKSESQVVVQETRVAQYRAQIARLQEQIDVLRLRYTDTYPDIIDLKYQISDLEKSLAAAIQSNERAGQPGNDASSSAATAPSVTNPFWQQLRQDRSNMKTLVAALESRVRDNERALQDGIKWAKRIPEVEAVTAELYRDYEVNDQIYQDLLRRRENARVSMNMDLEQSGTDFRVLYPANVPVAPDGLRLMHFAIAGPLLGLLLPVFWIIVMLQIDPRIRHEDQFSGELGLELLGEIGMLYTLDEERHNRKVLLALCVGLIAVVAVYGYVGWGFIRALVQSA